MKQPLAGAYGQGLCVPRRSDAGPRGALPGRRRPGSTTGLHDCTTVTIITGRASVKAATVAKVDTSQDELTKFCAPWEMPGVVRRKALCRRRNTIPPVARGSSAPDECAHGCPRALPGVQRAHRHVHARIPATRQAGDGSDVTRGRRLNMASSESQTAHREVRAPAEIGGRFLTWRLWRRRISSPGSSAAPQ